MAPGRTEITHCLHDTQMSSMKLIEWHRAVKRSYTICITKIFPIKSLERRTATKKSLTACITKMFTKKPRLT